VAIVGLDGRQRSHPIWAGNPIILGPDELIGPDAIHVLQSGPGCRPYIVYPFDEQTGWTFNTAFKCREHIAKLYLTPQERARGDAARQRHGPYVLIEPFTKHQNFRWPIDRWDALVKACPDLTFVQHTHRDSVPIMGAHPEPATFRDACGLLTGCDLYVRSESGLCHAAAALGIPQVTLFGGCMDPDVMGYYPDQWVIRDRDPGSPCGRWLPCAHCVEAMKHITVEQVAAAIRFQLRRRAA
jgi:ADP-heptose:LPS heptosyltransferase